jgi:hypothetical protein
MVQAECLKMIERWSELSEAFKAQWKLSQRHWGNTVFGMSAGQAGIEIIRCSEPPIEED